MNQISAEFATKAYQWCRQYLRGVWATLEKHEFQVSTLSGTGLSNYLFICSVSSNVRRDSQPTYSCPDKVLLRIHGDMLDTADSLMAETIVFTLLAERNIAPKVYGIFSGGRLEEYIPSRCLKVEEMREKGMSVDIASKLAKFHTMELPLPKQPIYLMNTSHRWLHKVVNDISFNNPEQERKFQRLLSFSLTEEIQFVEQVVNATPSPSVFCHNDLNEGNILLVDDETKDKHIRFIDFEYASYNYRGFDIANHFCEWTLDYAYNTSPPYYKYTPEHYPSKEEQLTFIRAYLTNANESYESSPLDVQEALEQNLLTEIKRFTLPCHFFWVLWSIVQAQRSYHSFGYLDYALDRLDAYHKLKQQLITSFPPSRTQRVC
ncbi:choline/ethanolamine kinase-like [Glandiceps talaboti]